MSENSYCIYVHINKINGKIYIGQTSQNVNKRWNNGNGYKKCTYFYRAIQKYGWDNFKHIILFDNLSLEMANIIEEQLIIKYDTTNNLNGYNIMFGGNNCKLPDFVKKKISESKTGQKLSEETKNKISESLKNGGAYWTGKHLTKEMKELISKSRENMKMSEETKRKISESMKGENNHFYGKHHSEETREKMKENHADFSGKNSYWYGKHLSDETKEKLRQANIGENNPNYGTHWSEERKEKMVKQLTGQKRTREQKENIKNNHADFSGDKHPLYGKHHSEETKNKLSISCSIPVDMFDLDDNYIKTFYGMSEAQKETGANYMGISRCCNGKQKTCGGYKWRYSNKS